MSRNRWPLFPNTALILFLLLATGGFGQSERFVLPSDEGPSDASFVAFRKKLVAAVKDRDSSFIYGILDKDVKLSFGGDEGIADFKRIWKIENSKSEFWSEFRTAISNGGAFHKDTQKKTFCAPYYFMKFPADLDVFDHQLIFGKNVNLRSGPNLDARVITRLSYNVVTINPEQSADDAKTRGNYTWIKVKTLGGKSGFVSAKYVKSPVGYRACFEKSGGRWRMTAFIAGD